MAGILFVALSCGIMGVLSLLGVFCVLDVLGLFGVSRVIQVRPPHANKSGFAISAIDKYKLGSRYR